MRTPSARQKYTAIAIITGTRPAQALPARFVTSPTNQTKRKRREMASALPLR